MKNVWAIVCDSTKTVNTKCDYNRSADQKKNNRCCVCVCACANRIRYGWGDEGCPNQLSGDHSLKVRSNEVVAIYCELGDTSTAMTLLS